MKVQYGKDVASHSGPELCGGARAGGAEALTGETGGSAIEPRNRESGGPALLSDAEGNTRQSDISESRCDPARPETLPTPGSYPHRSREISAVSGATTPGNSGKATRRSNRRWRSRMRSYYLGSRRTREITPRRWWRDATPPKETPNRFPRPGLGAGSVARRRAWNAYVRRRAGIGGAVPGAQAAHYAAATCGQLLQSTEECGGGRDVAGVREDPSSAGNRMAPDGSCRSLASRAGAAGVPTPSGWPTSGSFAGCANGSKRA